MIFNRCSNCYYNLLVHVENANSVLILIFLKIILICLSGGSTGERSPPLETVRGGNLSATGVQNANPKRVN